MEVIDGLLGVLKGFKVNETVSQGTVTSSNDGSFQTAEISTIPEPPRVYKVLGERRDNIHVPLFGEQLFKSIVSCAESKISWQ